MDAAAQHVGDDEGAAAVRNAGDIEPVQVVEIFGDELRRAKPRLSLPGLALA